MSVMLFVFLALILLLMLKTPHTPPQVEEETLSHRLISGIRFVFKNQVLLGTMSLDMFAVLFGGAVAMLPVFAAEVLKVGPQGLGFYGPHPWPAR